MACECRLEEGEERTCGTDCLNRQLYIECRSKCNGGRCGNQRIRRRENGPVEPFLAGAKGRGVRANGHIQADDFILEYVGEVVDDRGMTKRLKRYSSDSSYKHHYVMAYQGDLVIDATAKGSISRFINHSCDPNATTQKWLVDGQLRIGFFALRQIEPGEEITFDYKFERYGKSSQECLCGAANCRGVIGVEKRGGSTELETGEETEREMRERKERRKRRRALEREEEMANELAVLGEKGRLRTRQDVLGLSRLMVRGDDFGNKMSMLGLLSECEEGLLRVFLDFTGLTILSFWLNDDSLQEPANKLRTQLGVLELLGKLPIPNRTMIRESNVLEWVERAASGGSSSRDEAVVEELVNELVETICSEEASPSSASPDSSSLSLSLSTASLAKPVDEAAESNLRDAVAQAAAALLQSWAHLKESFKIPKKRKEEASSDEPLDKRRREERRSIGSREDKHNRSSGELRRRRSPSPRRRRSFKRSRSPSPRRRRSEVSRPEGQVQRGEERAAGGGNRRRSRFDIGPDGGHQPLSAEEAKRRRRKAFEQTVAVENAAADVSDFDLAASIISEQLGQEVPGTTGSDQAGEEAMIISPGSSPVPQPCSSTAEPAQPRTGVPAFNASTKTYWWTEPVTGNFVYEITPEQHAAMGRGEADAFPNFLYEPHSGLIREVPRHPIPAPVPIAPPEPEVPAPVTQAAPQQSQEEIEALKKKVEMLERALQAKQGEPVSMEPVPAPQSNPVPEAISAQPVPVPRPIPAPVEPPRLPPSWQLARDEEGTIYYYNTLTRKTQWEPPTVETSEVELLETTPEGVSTTMAAADTTSSGAGAAAETAKRVRETFKAEVSAALRKWLEPYRRPDAPKGRITSSEDFKHVARKLTHVVWEKELKRAGNLPESTKPAANILPKAKIYVKEYMERQGPIYKRKSTTL